MENDEFGWLQLLQSFGICASFLFSSWTLTRDMRAKKAANYLTITQQHRDIWKLSLLDESLLKVTDQKRDVIIDKITAKEHRYVTFTFFHLMTYFEMHKIGHVTTIEGIAADIRNTMMAPAVRKVWEESKHFYNDDFVAFVDNAVQNSSRCGM